MADFPDAPTGAPGANGSSYVQATKDNAAAAYEQLSSGPMAQNLRDESAKTSNEFSNLAASRKTPANPAATGQPLTHYHSFFSELLSWKNPRASAIAYASVVTFILAARYLDILRYSLKLTYFALGTTVLAELVGKLVLNHGLATQIRPRRYYTISKETLDAAIGDVHELVNFFVIEAQRILFAENVGASAAAFIGAFLAYYLVKVMPFWGLALTATTVLFVAPLVYTSNQELIDAQLKNASDIIGEQTSQFRAVAGKHTAQATEITKQYMGDYTHKAQALLGRNTSETSPMTPVPVASDPVSDVKEADFPAAPSSDFTKDTVEVPAEPVVPDDKPMVAS